MLSGNIRAATDGTVSHEAAKPALGEKEKTMSRRAYLFAVVSMLLPVGIASAQESYPIKDQIPLRPSG